MSKISAQYGKLTDSEKNYFKTNPHHAKAIYDSKQIAFAETKRRFGENGHNGKTDAFRHCFWSAILCRDIGYAGALAFTIAHEGFTSNPVIEKQMDLHNNSVGLRYGMSKASDSVLAEYCATAFKVGRLKVIK